MKTNRHTSVPSSPESREYIAEALEPRVLYSAAPVAVPVEIEEQVESGEDAARQLAGFESANAFAEEFGVDSIGYSGNSIGYNGAESTIADSATVRILNVEQLNSLIDEAESRWEQSGLSTDQLAVLEEIDFQIIDLDGPTLGYAEGSTIVIDADAAGMGWYVDSTPADDSEFSGSTFGAMESVDLLSVMTHEIGHVLGLQDVYDVAQANDVMYGLFEAGERRSIAEGRAEGSEMLSLVGAHFATATVDTGTGVVDVTGDGTNTNTFTEVGGNLFLNGNDLGIATSAVTQLSYIGANATNDVVRFEGTLNFGDTTIDIGSTVSNGASNGVRDIDFRGDVILTGSGSFTGVAHRTIEFDPNDISGTTSGITTEDGNISLTAIRDDGNGDGIRFREGTNTVQSTNGNIYLEGEANGTGSSRRGVFMANNGTTVIQTSGDITIIGRGAGDDDGNVGVLLDDNATVQTTGSGSISITGTAGGGNVDTDNPADGNDSNDGIFIDGRIISGDGNITLVGTGGTGLGDDADGNDGVDLSNNNALIQSSGGLISITGTGGQTATTGGVSDGNRGVYIDDGNIVATGNASIYIEGTGGTGNSFLRGVLIANDGESITAEDGDVTIVGVGGTSNTATGANNDGVRIDDEITITGSGSVSITGTGGSGGFNPANNDSSHRGVTFNATDATVTTNTGNITIVGQGGNATDGDLNDGVQFGSSGDRLVSTSGNISVTGTGGEGRREARGVYVTSGTVIRSGGNIAITGTGGDADETTPTVESDQMVGVEVDGSIIASGTGTVTIVGNGGTGNDDNHFGIDLSNAASLIEVEDGDMTLNGTGGTGDASGFGIRLQLDGATLRSTGSGDINVIGTGGDSVSNNRGIYVEGAVLIDSQGTGAINITGTGGTVGSNADGMLFTRNTGQTNRDEFATIQSNSGAITIVGTGGPDIGAGGGADGIQVNDGDATNGFTVTSTSGNIDITGRAGLGGGNDQRGVLMGAFSVVETGGAGTLSMTGFGGEPGGVTDRGEGLDLRGRIETLGTGALTLTGTAGGSGGDSDDNVGIVLADAAAVVRVNDGNLTISGTGGGNGNGDDNNDGVRLDTAGATIAAVGGGDIAITGNAGVGDANNRGVRIDDGTSVTAAGGSITIDGVGAGTLTGNHGVYLEGTVTNTGSGSITFNGTGGNGTASNRGVYLNNDTNSATITAVNGTISLNGAGGDGSANFNEGVRIEDNSLVQTTGTGAIDIDGVSGNGGTDTNRGVSVFDSATIAAGGTVTIDGTAANSSGTDNFGIVLQNTGNVTAANGASITLVGVGADGTTNNRGIQISGADVTTVGGDISMTGTGGNGTDFNRGIDFRSGSAVTSGGGDVTLNGTGNGGGDADGVRIADATVDSGAGALSITGVAVANGEGIELDNAITQIGSGTQSGDITFTTDRYSGDQGSVQTTGDINFASVTAGHDIFVGRRDDGTEDSGNEDQSSGLEIADNELVNIADGFSNINFTTTGDIEVDIHGVGTDAVQSGGTVSLTSLDVGTAVTVGGVAYQVREKSPNFDLEEVTNLAPVANADVNSVTEDGGAANGTVGSNATGNVLGGTGVSAGDVADTDADADDDPTAGDGSVVVTNISFGGTPHQTTNQGGHVAAGGTTSIDGTYGTLTIGSDGQYSYTLDQAVADGLDSTDAPTEVFTYTIIDGNEQVNSPAAHYAFDELNGVPEDSRGGGAPSLGGSYQTTDGINGEAFDLNPNNNDAGPDHLDVPVPAGMTVGEFTVSFWVNTTTVHGSWNDLFGIGIGSPVNGSYVLEMPGGGASAGSVAGFNISGTVPNTNSITGINTSIADGNWHHVVLSASTSGNTASIYIDGVQEGTTTWAGTAPITALRLGDDPNRDDRNIQAAFDDLRIYDVALSGAEVTEVYNQNGVLGEQATLTIAVNGTNDDPVALDNTGKAVESGGDANGTTFVGSDGTTTGGTRGNVIQGSATVLSLTASHVQGNPNHFNTGVTTDPDAILQGLLDDGFAYDPNDPTSASPNQNFAVNGGNGIHEAFAGDHISQYDFASSVTLHDGNEIVVDLWGRSGGGVVETRDNDIDIQFLDAAGNPIAGGIVSGQMISDDAAAFLRVSSNGTLANGTVVGGFQIIGHISDGGGINQFALMEVRSAEIVAADTDVDGDDIPVPHDGSVNVTNIAFGGTPFSGSTNSGGSVGGGASTQIDGAYGTLTIGADGSYSYAINEAVADSLDEGEEVTEVFTYTFSDGSGSDTSSLTITVCGKNDIPSAQDDSANALENGSDVTIAVTANDSDPDGDSISLLATSVSSTSTLGAPLTVSGSSVIYNISGVSTPAIEALAVGETILDTFTYQVTDGQVAPIFNDDFESATGGNTGDSTSLTNTGWTQFGNTQDPVVTQTYTSAPAQNLPGTGIWLQAWTDGQTGGFYKDTAAEEGVVYEFSGDLLLEDRFASNGGNITFDLIFLDAGGNTLLTQSVDPTNQTINTFINSSVSATAPAGTETVRTQVSWSTDAVADADDSRVSGMLDNLALTGAGLAEATVTVTLTGVNDPVTANDDGNNATVWQVGFDNNTTTEFEQEGPNSNAAPGDPNARDDDYYFAGTYAGVGTVVVDEVFGDGINNGRGPQGFERALTNTDQTNRIHFNLPNDPTDENYRLLVDTVSSNFPTGGIDFQVSVNGSSVYNANVTADGLIQIDFSGAGGLLSGENVITLERTDTNGGWLQFDYIALQAEYILTEDAADNTQVGNVTANDSDIDVNGNAPDDTLTVTSVGATAIATSGNTTVVGTYGSLVIDATGAYTYTLDNADADTQALEVGDLVSESFTYLVSDSNGSSDTATLTITVAGANDLPVLASIETAAATYNEGAAPIQVTNTITVTDVDSATDADTTAPHPTNTDANGDDLIVSATIQITAGLDSADDVLALSGALPAGITASAYDASTGTITLTGNATPVDYQAALRLITYQNADTLNPSTATRTVSFTVNDSDGDSNTQTRDINVVDIPEEATALDDDFTAECIKENDNSAAQITASVLDNDANVIADATSSTGYRDGSGNEIQILNFDAISANGGAVSMNADGTFTYTASGAAIDSLDEGETLIDTFTYTITDGDLAQQGQFRVTLIDTADEDSVLDDPASLDGTMSNFQEVVNLMGGVVGGGLNTVNGRTYNVIRYATDFYNEIDLGVGGPFTSNLAYPDGTSNTIFNQFAIGIEGEIFIPAGTYQIGFRADDELAIHMSGLTLGAGGDLDTSTTGGNVQTITHNGDDYFRTGGANRIGVITLTVPAGGITTDFSAFGREGGGGDSFEIFVRDASSGSLHVGESNITSFDASQWTILSDNAAGWRVNQSASAGTTSTATVTVKIEGENDAPVTIADYGQVTEASDAVSNDTTVGNVLTNDTDIDDSTSDPTAGQPGNSGSYYYTPGALDSYVTVSAVTGGTVGGGGVITAVGTYGTLTINPDGSYTYQLNDADADTQALNDGDTPTEVFTYTVSDNHPDGNGQTATGELTISVFGVNDSPDAVNDSATVQEDTTLTASGNVVTSNDTDPSGDNVVGDLQVEAVDGTAANIGSTLAGTYGSVVINADGSYTYTLNNGTDGDGSNIVQQLNDGETVFDTFTYTVSDGVESFDQPNNDGLFQVSAFQLDGNPQVNSIDVARAIWDANPSGAGSIAATNGTTYDITAYEAGTTGVINYSNNLGGFDRINGNLDFDTIGGGTITNADQLSVRAETYMTFTNAGTYSIAIRGDDGRFIRLSDPNNPGSFVFDDAVGNVDDGSGAGFDFIEDRNTGNGEAVGVFTVTAGQTLHLDTLYFEHFGGDSFEIAIKSGTDTTYRGTGDGWALLSDGVLGVELSSDAITQRSATDSATLTITISGENDAPAVTPSTGTVYEDAVGGPSVASGDALAGATDIDHTAAELSIATVDGQAVGASGTTAVSSTYGSIAIDASGAWVYTLNNNLPQVQALDSGQVATEVFTFEMVDDDGARSTSTITVRVIGHTDANTDPGDGTQGETPGGPVGDTSFAGIVSLFNDLPEDLMFSGFRLDNGDDLVDGFDPIRSVSLTPFFAGHSTPGSTVEVIIKDDVGNELSSASTFADQAGNWSTPVFADIDRDARYTVEVRQTPNYWGAALNSGVVVEPVYLHFEGGDRAIPDQLVGLNIGDIIGDILRAQTAEEYVALLSGF